MDLAGIVRGIFFTSLLLVSLPALAQSPSESAATPESGASQAQASPAAGDPAALGLDVQAGSTPPRTITLWWMLQKGGVINWIILGMSVLTVIMMLYFFITVSPRREVPLSFVKMAHAQIRAGDIRGAYQMCEGRNELLPRVLQAGLRMAGHDRFVIQDAMESEGERGATELWQKISYLNNVGSIAPLLGLLGTVFGMIRAFGAIAFIDSQAKGLIMAEGVAQAMITTAAGLSLAIPAMLAYYYLRGRVNRIIAEVEAHASELIEAIAAHRRDT